MTDLPTENARLRAALERWQSYGCPDCNGDCGSANPPMSFCIMQETAAALATPAPDAVQEAAISEVVQHESTRRWFHGEATHEEIMECVKAMDAAVAKWCAIAGDRT